MKLHDIIKIDETIRLYHPIVGFVKWDDLQDGQGWALYFAHGPDKNDPLFVDMLVLFDDEWVRYDPPWEGKLGRIADQCLACGTRESDFQVSSHPTLCLKCYTNGKKPNKHLVRRREELETVAIRKWCEENGLDFEWEYGIFN